jgi:hypothetical protein
MTGSRFFDRFVPDVRKLCDQIYEQHDSGTTRRQMYFKLGVSLIESMIPEFDMEEGQQSLLDDVNDLDDFFPDITSSFVSVSDHKDLGDETVMASVLVGENQADLGGPSSLPFDEVAATQPDGKSSATHPESIPLADHATQDQQDQAQKIEADSCCEICGYRPKGDPQWFRGSMAKHKKLQHSTAPPKIYKCPYPGCTSQYKNRPDNLRQHQIEKGHFVGDEASSTRRPVKRKKLAEDEE